MSALTPPELPPAALGEQLRLPKGDVGIDVGRTMSVSNRELYGLAAAVMNVEDGAQILEIGLGNGELTNLLLAINTTATVTGIELSSVMLQEAQRNLAAGIAQGRVILDQGDFRKMSYPSGSVDWVVGINVLYFWEEPPRELAELRRLLSPRGRLLLGFRPRSVLEHQPFAESFRMLEIPELEVLLHESGLTPMLHRSKEVARRSADGRTVNSTEVVMVAQRT